MKTKEIIAHLDIQEGIKGKKEKEFFTLMETELKDLYAQFGQEDSERHFDAAVKMLRHKWDGVSKKIKWGLSDGSWSYFYATSIIRIKKELCSTWAAKKRTEHEMYELRQAKKVARQNRYKDFYDPEE